MTPQENSLIDEAQPHALEGLDEKALKELQSRLRSASIINVSNHHVNMTPQENSLIDEAQPRALEGMDEKALKELQSRLRPSARQELQSVAAPGRSKGGGRRVPRCRPAGQRTTRRQGGGHRRGAGPGERAPRGRPRRGVVPVRGLSRIKKMALSIKDPEADRLARELAARTGESLTQAVVVALRERLARETGRTRSIPLAEELAGIRRRCAALPVLDARTAEEILGYDERGLPA